MAASNLQGGLPTKTHNGMLCFIQVTRPVRAARRGAVDTGAGVPCRIIKF